MLDYKGIDYKRTDLMPVVSKGALRAVGFPGITVPALKIDGEKIQGSRQIARALDRIQPEPPLFPADPDARAAVEDAERFGDEELQHPIRQLLWWASSTTRRTSAATRRAPSWASRSASRSRPAARSSPSRPASTKPTDANARAALAALPDLLDRVDAYIADGTIGGEQPNAADFQIATSIGLALTLDDLKPLIETRPAGALARAGRPGLPRPHPADPSRRPGSPLRGAAPRA